MSHKSVHWYQCFSLWKMLDGECLVHDKEKFVLKTLFFPKNALFSKIMSQSKDFVWLIQAPNISKHISRNKGATIKASQKTAQDKGFFLFWGKKTIFSQKMAAPSQKREGP